MAPSRTIRDEIAMQQLQDAVRRLLIGIGEDVSREGLIDTPKRVSKALMYMTSGYNEDPEGIVCKAIFNEREVAAEATGMVVVKDIDFASTCEESLLPFHGRVHIAYTPSEGRVLGLSKMSRLTSIFARRLQTQSRMSAEILDAIMKYLKPKGAAIIVEARHLAHSESSGKIVSSDTRGIFSDPQAAAWLEFVALLRMQGINLGGTTFSSSNISNWALSGRDTNISINRSDTVTVKHMHEAVKSILISIGEDPNRKGLVSTAETYVGWLLQTTEGFCNSGFKRGASSLLLPGLANEVMSMRWTRESIQQSAAEPWHLQMEHDSVPASLSTSPTSCVMMRLPFASQCEHHLLPFYGTATVVLLPSEATGLPEMHDVLPIVRRFSRRLQVQERLTIQIADAVEAAVRPHDPENGVQFAGLLVVCDAKHMCMVARGVEKAASSTLTYAARGCVERDPALRVRIMGAIASSCAHQGCRCQCPGTSSSSVPL